MKKVILILILTVCIIPLGMYGVYAGDLDPNAPPAPTMHTLNEIYDLVASSFSLPRYQSSSFDLLGYNDSKNIHEGSGTIHSIIVSTFWPHGSDCSAQIELKDGDNKIAYFNICPHNGGETTRMFTLDAAYESNLNIKHYTGDCMLKITVIYLPEN